MSTGYSYEQVADNDLADFMGPGGKRNKPYSGPEYSYEQVADTSDLPGGYSEKADPDPVHQYAAKKSDDGGPTPNNWVPPGGSNEEAELNRTLASLNEEHEIVEDRLYGLYSHPGLGYGGADVCPDRERGYKIQLREIEAKKCEVIGNIQNLRTAGGPWMEKAMIALKVANSDGPVVNLTGKKIRLG
jgi:hypothetical protein